MDGRTTDRSADYRRTIKAVRLKAGLTHGQFTGVIGESPAALNGYEHRQVVPLRVLSTIAQKFNVNWVWLETGIGKAEES